MSRFIVRPERLSGIRTVERQENVDARGSFTRLFCATELAEAGWTKPIAQLSHSHTVQRGSIRGMHFQYPPRAEMKLVSCIAGAIWDIAVDIRAGSETFGQHCAVELSAANRRSLLVPEGYAHGFQTLTDNVVLIYCMSETYVADAQGGLNPLDPRLALQWPLPVSEMSARDREHALLDDQFRGLVL